MTDFNEKMTVTLDYANIFKNKVGKSGIDSADIDKIRPEINQALKTIQKRHRDGQIGFRDLVNQEALLESIEKYRKSIEGRFRQIVVLGIGGSALGGITIQTALNHAYQNLLARQAKSPGQREIYFYDNVDPDQLSDLFDVLDFKETLFIVITKSGNTAETISSYLLIRQMLKERIGADFAQHILALTDPVKGNLRVMAKKDNCQTFDIPPDVGGRFSVLTSVGLVPAALSGVDVAGLLAGAAFAREKCESESAENPAAILAAIYYQMEKMRGSKYFCDDALCPPPQGYRRLVSTALGRKPRQKRGP